MGRIFFYVGTEDKYDSSFITLCELNLSTGVVSKINFFNHCRGPGYLCISPTGGHLYAISSDNKIYAFSIEPNYDLTYINSLSTEGLNPCHVSIHPSGKFVFVTNYSDGTFIIFSLEKNGNIGSIVYMDNYTGNSINAIRQDKSHPHCAVTSPNGKYLYVTDLGTDKIVNYSFDENSYRFVSNSYQPFYLTELGAGPRHLTIDRIGKNLFLINELNATLVHCSLDEFGVIHTKGIYKTIPSDWKLGNLSSAIRLHPNGKYVYVANRGHNSISAFKICSNQTLEKIDEITKDISVPRDFNIDPTGRYMIIANQYKNNLVIYTIDTNTGMLNFLRKSIKIIAPICIITA